MTTTVFQKVFSRLRQAELRRDGAGLTDGQLLSSFVVRRDEAAFAALVHRHGPMVLGVCRRVVGDEHDAEDAFQATFLVLVRRAATVRPRDLVGNWLFGVAYRTAMKARTIRLRRSSREKQVTAMPHPSVEPNSMWTDLQPLLDEELHRLPEKYRAAVVLCDVEGRPRREVARQLRIPDGTLSNRLTAARRMLARRLANRGVTLSAGALATLMTHNATASALPAVLAESTINAATQFAAGAATAASGSVIALTEGVLKAMMLTKIKLAISIVTVAILVIGTGFQVIGISSAQAEDDGRPARPTTTRQTQPPEKARPPEKAEDILLRKWLESVGRDVPDEVFIRRMCLDIIRQPPTPLEVKLFVADKDPQKREKLIDYLLEQCRRDEKQVPALPRAGDLKTFVLDVSVLEVTPDRKEKQVATPTLAVQDGVDASFLVGGELPWRQRLNGNDTLFTVPFGTELTVNVARIENDRLQLRAVLKKTRPDKSTADGLQVSGEILQVFKNIRIGDVAEFDMVRDSPMATSLRFRVKVTEETVRVTQPNARQ